MNTANNYSKIAWFWIFLLIFSFQAEDLGILLLEQIGMRDNQRDVLAAIINNGGVSNNKDYPEACVVPPGIRLFVSSWIKNN